MALSFCSNWSTLQHLNPEISNFQQAQSDLSPELLAFHENFSLADTCIDPLLEPNDFIYSDNCTHLLPCYSPPSDHLISLGPEFFPPKEFESYRYSKSQKSYEDHYCSDFTPYFFNGYVPNCTSVHEFSPDLLLPDFQFPSVFACGSGESVKKPNGGSLSTQSIAARQRRRKITEKTQELGKLIPGGNKMNTAEMFQAAFNYVKYLQAQVGILELMESIQLNDQEPFHTEELQVLVASPIIQEKLYSEEKCLVPEQFLQTLANDRKLQSNPLILKDINQLIQTNG